MVLGGRGGGDWLGVVGVAGRRMRLYWYCCCGVTQMVHLVLRDSRIEERERVSLAVGIGRLRRCLDVELVAWVVYLCSGILNPWIEDFAQCY